MFVNFCSKLAFMKFNRLTYINHKERHIIICRRPRISSKMLPTFSNSAWTNWPAPTVHCRCPHNWTTEAGYRPVLTGCLPLKCDFFNFFQKTSFFVVFWVSIYRLSGGFRNQICDVLCIYLIHTTFARQLVDESDNKAKFIGKPIWYFDLACNMQPNTSCKLQL